jgi:hypothetical protein
MSNKTIYELVQDQIDEGRDARSIIMDFCKFIEKNALVSNYKKFIDWGDERDKEL